MKEKIANLLIYLLRKLEVSVIIGFTITNGSVSGKNKYCFYYDDFDNVKVLDKNGNLLDIPEGPFRIEVKIND
jgi:hypothetical protein